jgi:hypothetical protein
MNPREERVFCMWSWSERHWRFITDGVVHGPRAIQEWQTECVQNRSAANMRVTARTHSAARWWR